MIWEEEAPQAIKTRLRVTFRPHRSRAGALLLDNSCVSYTAEASRELKACAWPNANDLPKGGTSALKGPRIPAQGHALGLAKAPQARVLKERRIYRSAPRTGPHPPHCGVPSERTGWLPN